ncbi:hypothetical protein F4802DRAFT_592375 [Xylaria palmicola]|nr:hypothetical protein F4802DRAFT_592375 [Xylaria palmicola]
MMYGNEAEKQEAQSELCPRYTAIKKTKPSSWSKFTRCLPLNCSRCQNSWKNHAKKS